MQRTGLLLLNQQDSGSLSVPDLLALLAGKEHQSGVQRQSGLDCDQLHAESVGVVDRILRVRSAKHQQRTRRKCDQTIRGGQTQLVVQ